MTNNNLTDAEIIKALECCTKETNDCENCPANQEFEYWQCFDEVKLLALDLINRQKAKVEYYKENRDKYQDDVMFLSKQGDELQAEIERLKEEICIQHKIIDERGAEVLRHDRCIRTLHDRLKTVKAEAYKECIEKVKILNQNNLILWNEQLNNLLKELVGENNADK